METESFFAGIMVAVFLLFFINLITGFEGVQARLAVASCEEELPRNQYCEVTAIPTQEDSKDE